MSKIHTTNYIDTFIEVSKDCPATTGEMPPKKVNKKSLANYQFDLLYDHPYEYTSDDIFFIVEATRKEIPVSEWEEHREAFFSKGQPCFRSSPLTKRYGWGIHSDAQGKVAMYALDSDEYKAFLKDNGVKKVKAMASVASTLK